MQSSRYFGNSFLREIKPRAFEVGFKIVVRPAPLPAFDQRRQPVERRHIESEHLADFLCRGTPAIGTDIRGHRRAAFAVAQIHVLNCFFPLVAARKIQVNIRPFPALFRQKALEQQIHTDRIDGRNAQRIAHRAVCRRPPALHQNPAFEAVADDVPDDEKITGQLQLLDQRQLVFQLPPHALGDGAIAVSRPLPYPLSQKGIHRFAIGHGITGKIVAQFFQCEFKTRGKLGCIRDRFETIGKKPRHAFGAAHMP